MVNTVAFNLSALPICVLPFKLVFIGDVLGWVSSAASNTTITTCHFTQSQIAMDPLPSNHIQKPVISLVSHSSNLHSTQAKYSYRSFSTRLMYSFSNKYSMARFMSISFALKRSCAWSITSFSNTLCFTVRLAFIMRTMLAVR